MAEPELIKVLTVNNKLGEGIIWDANQQAAWWTDILHNTLYRYSHATNELATWQTPERLACFALIEGRSDLIAGFESGFAFYDPQSNKIEWLHKVEPESSATRLNDGRADRQGRFWVGTMAEDNGASGALGSLYCLDNKLQCHKTIQDIKISNSLCWSPDSKFLYHTDTPNQCINRYEFDAESGSLGQKAAFAHTETGCFPDGSTIDAEGYIWNAQWGGSKVVRYAPSGAIDFELALPVSQPTCVAFGGPELNHLFITSAHADLSEQQQAAEPMAGNVLVFKTEFKGLSDPKFIVSN